MELRHLRYFVAVAEEQNVTKASSKLHVSQPAVSRQIRDLEAELGVQLLQRTAKAVKLTAPGTVFLREARAVLERIEQAVMAVRGAGDGECGDLHVGYAPSLTVEILPKALRSFQALFPKVRVLLHDLSSAEMIEQLKDNRLQVALSVPPANLRAVPDLKFQKIAEYPLCAGLAPGHPLATRKALDFQTVGAEPLIGYAQEEFPEYHTRLVAIFAKVGVSPRIAEEHDSVTSLIAAVEAARGIAVVPRCMACLAGPRMILIPITPEPPPVIVGAITSRIAGRAAEAFVAAAAS